MVVSDRTTGSDAPNAVDVQIGANANGTGAQDGQPDQKTAGVDTSVRNSKDSGGDVVATFKGVQWDRKNNRWRARLHTDRTRHVGYFPTEEEAGRAWDQALLRFTCGEDTIKKLNFPEESFAKFKEFLSFEGDLDRFDLRGVVKNETEPAKFSACILHNRQQINVGTFSSAREAAIAYDWKTIQCFGWGSLTNFPLANYEVEYIRNGGLCPLDNSALPAFPNHKRFSDSEKAIQIINPSEQAQFAGSKRGRLEQQHQLGIPTIFPGIAGQPPAMDPKLAQLIQQSGMNLSFHPFLQYPGVSGSPRMAGTTPQPQPPQILNGNSETVVEVGEHQWKSSLHVDIGVYRSNDLAKEACERAKLCLNGYSSCAPSNLIKFLNHIERTTDQLEHKIKERNGAYYITLHIHARGFELGPYKSLEQARIAHDKYALLIDGGKAKTFNPLIDILLEKDEAKSLLSALGADTQVIQPVINPNSQVPQSSILANAFTSTLRKVASQASLHEEGHEFNKQLEKIESSIEGIQAVSKQQQMTTEVPGVQQMASVTACPLPPFPQRSPPSKENNDV